MMLILWIARMLITASSHLVNKKKNVISLWKKVSEIVEKNYKSDLSTAGKKISLISESAIKSNLSFKTKYKILK